MLSFKNVRGTQPVKPLDIEIIGETVYVRNDIKPIHIPSTNDMPGFDGWEYDETQYAKDEYIKLISEQNKSTMFALESVEMALLGLLL